MDTATTQEAARAAQALREAARGHARNIQEAYVVLIHCAGVSPQLSECDGPGGDRFSRERFEAACLALAAMLDPGGDAKQDADD